MSKKEFILGFGIVGGEKKCVTLQANHLEMTEKDLRKTNPWKRVAEMLKSEEEDCLFREKNKEWYVLPEDQKEIEAFNRRCTKENQIITNTPPEPWRGNPLQANLILLSLNPGYDPNINESLAKLIQANKSVRKELIKFRQKTLNLTADSFMPPKDDKKPISCFEAEDMISGWYWTKKFKELREAAEIDESEFYRRVAMIEFHGYSSISYKEWYKEQPSYLDSQLFNMRLIQYIIEHQEEVCFLVLRSWDLWEGLLDSVEKDYVTKHIDIFKINEHPRCQYITENNLGKTVWNEIITAVKKEPKKKQ